MLLRLMKTWVTVRGAVRATKCGSRSGGQAQFIAAGLVDAEVDPAGRGALDERMGVGGHERCVGAAVRARPLARGGVEVLRELLPGAADEGDRDPAEGHFHVFFFFAAAAAGSGLRRTTGTAFCWGAPGVLRPSATSFSRRAVICATTSGFAA